MKLTHVVFAAALVPAGAFAGPADQPQPNPEESQPSGTNPSDFGDNAPQPKAERRQLGVMAKPLTPELRAFFGPPNDGGVLVARVLPDSIAAHSGIRVGDVITKVGDQTVTTAADVTSALSSSTKATVPIQVVRDHKTIDMQAKFGGSKDMAPGNM